MLESGATESQAQVCAFMGIGSNEQEMVPLNLEGKVGHSGLNIPDLEAGLEIG